MCIKGKKQMQKVDILEYNESGGVSVFFELFD